MDEREGTYAPGDGVAVVTERFSALVLADRGHPAVEILVDAAFDSDNSDGNSGRASAQLERVLDALGRRGFEDLPPLGIVSWESGLCRLVLRGGVVAEVTDSTAADPALVDSDGIRTWSEHVLADATAVTLRNRSDQVDVRFWTTGGVVAAAALRCVERFQHPVPLLTLHPESQVVGGTERPAPDSGRLDDPSSELDPVETVTPADELGRAGDESNDEPAVEPGQGEVDAEDLDGRTLLPPGDPIADEEIDPSGTGVVDVGAPEEGSAAVGDPAGKGAESPRDDVSAEAGAPDRRADAAQTLIEQVPSTGGTPDPAGPADSDDESDGAYDHLFGSTMIRSVEGAAVRDDVEAAETPPATAVAGDHGDPLDHDGLTITVAELRELKAAGASGQSEPPVRSHRQSPDGEHLARDCPSGHLNPPNATACRVCGLTVEGEPFRIDRIELGSIRFSTGQVVSVAGTILIGRSPKVPLVAPGRSLGAVELVAVPSPQQDISRTHVELRVDGWQLLVTDLGSTNGTVIAIPGRDPQRLRSNESFPLPVGATVNLADEVQFAYEVGP